MSFLNQPTVHTPIWDEEPSDTAVHFYFGQRFGYVKGADGLTQYWEGQDIWLSPEDDNDTIYSVLKGTLHFIPSWHRLHPSTLSEGETADVETPAIGHTLILKVWPKEILDLGELLYDGAPIPREIIYQNVDLGSAIEAAKRLVRLTEHYLDVFRATLPDGLEASDSELEILVDTWVEEQWAQGKGSGIFVAAGQLLGRATTTNAIPPPPPEISTETEYFTPAEVPEPERWRRLTIKVMATDRFYYSPSYLFYLIQHVASDTWTTRPREDTSRFVRQCCTEVGNLPVFKVTIQLSGEWDPESLPEEDMPSALPSIRLEYTLSVTERSVPVIYDPMFDGLWRSQSELYEGEYELRRYGPSFLVQCDGTPLPRLRNLSPHPAPQLTHHEGLAVQHWLRFDGEGHVSPTGDPRFILGVNMETFRRRNKHDLAGNDILNFDYGYIDHHITDPTTRAGYFVAGANLPLLEQDLENISKLGTRVVRVWAFEGFEGLRFYFTQPTSSGHSLLDEEKAYAKHHPTSPRDLHWVSVDSEDFYVCDRDEWHRLRSRLMPTGVDPLEWIVSPDRNPLLTQLKRNTGSLQRIAGINHLRILWTFWVHYGEGGYEWDQGRLPVEAWIYRDTMTIYRRSFIEHAIRPFVEHIEASPGFVFGYELMNEPDIVWEHCGHTWTRHLKKGSDDVPTHWPLSMDEIRRFLADCSAVIPLNRVTLCGVLGSEPDCTAHELSLLTSGGSPALRLSAPAITRYASIHMWRTSYIPPLGGLGADSDACESVNDGRSYLSSHGTHITTDPRFNYIRGGASGKACLFTEAGSERLQSSYTTDDCIRHYIAVKEILRSALLKGYSGAFIWHYNDPDRASNSEYDTNALTEARGASGHNHSQRFPNLAHIDFAGAIARPACLAIKAFAELYERLLIAPL